MNVIKHNDIEIDAESPFINCKLDREKYANVLTSIVANYGDGFVLALNNKWGAGKTTFVKMWEQTLINEGYQTIYFNAWENDFEDNPLTALVGELNIIKKEDNTNFNKVVSSAAKLSKNILPAIAKGVLNKYVDSEIIIDVINESIRTATEIFEADVNDYVKRKESIKEFRKSLGEFVASNFNNKPLIFFIDELDRCRPNYSVSLLEQVKHFFNVPNIIFVLSIDKIQLGHAICGVYGSEKIDTNQYLKRFIDIEYTIPQPDSERFFEYLYNYYNFDLFFASLQRSINIHFSNDGNKFKKLLKEFIGNLSLREQEKVMSHTRIVINSLRSDNYLVPIFFTFLIYCKFKENDYYSKLKNKEFSIIESQDGLVKIINNLNNPVITSHAINIEAQLLISYNYYINSSNEQIFFYDSDVFTLKYNSKIDNERLIRYFEELSRSYDYDYLLTLKLNFFLDMIELTKNNIISS
ncbi:KAP family P-loop NTPase fold protein [Empedobacter brevis]|uniref:KAP family P-loop NTPase fold protein n=1 Tax=Empedobacter brevis TaxID=247 RepID=UPI0028B0B96F|nr:P-loop NTPase fold protein [Empedobacter brevis]